MKVKQFGYAADNLAYVLFGRTEAVAVDGGAVDDILSFVKKRSLVLKYVTNTHGHPDHTTGTQTLASRSGAVYLDHRRLAEKGGIDIDGDTVTVIPTPGHTMDSVTFVAEKALITGDTLFNGTVGNCFSGDLESFYNSVMTLARFPPDSVVYAGHDYVEPSMAFAWSLEPANAEIDRYLARYAPDHVRSTLADEFKVNPYLRFNEPTMIEVMNKKGLPVDTEYARWKSIMSIG